MKEADRTHPRVVIVGGGIAGLAAAWECHRHGCPAIVLEAQPRAGGVVRTDRVDAPASGSGLGLAIVRAVADLHAATLRLDASPTLGGLRVRVGFARADGPSAQG